MELTDHLNWGEEGGLCSVDFNLSRNGVCFRRTSDFWDRCPLSQHRNIAETSKNPITTTVDIAATAIPTTTIREKWCPRICEWIRMWSTHLYTRNNHTILMYTQWLLKRANAGFQYLFMLQLSSAITMVMDRSEIHIDILSTEFSQAVGTSLLKVEVFQTNQKEVSMVADCGMMTHIGCLSQGKISHRIAHTCMAQRYKSCSSFRYTLLCTQERQPLTDVLVHTLSQMFVQLQQLFSMTRLILSCNGYLLCSICYSTLNWLQ